MVRTIDTMHLGRDRVIAAHAVGELIVDPGPGVRARQLARRARGRAAGAAAHPHPPRPRRRHRHAGAPLPAICGSTCSEVGAPHLVDPARLLRSAGRLYGEDNMETLWGEVAPVPEGNVIALAGGEEVEGFRVEHVPGHASHHVAWLDLERGDAYVGDMAGVRIPPERGHPGADAAARDRRRGLARLDRPDRGDAARAASADPLRRGGRRRRAARPGPRGAAARARARSRRPRSVPGRVRGRDPRPRRCARPRPRWSRRRPPNSSGWAWSAICASAPRPTRRAMKFPARTFRCAGVLRVDQRLRFARTT